MIVPTVRIQDTNSDGFRVINECDFCKESHTLYNDAPKPAPAPLKPTATPEPAVEQVSAVEAPVAAPAKRTRKRK